MAAWVVGRGGHPVFGSEGLACNEGKTRVVTLEEGFDFLGFNVRRYRGKLLIRPSKAAVRRIRERCAPGCGPLRGTNAPTVIKRLNPIIRGWAAYHRTQVSSATFSALDDYLWQLIYKWVAFSHSSKPKRWVIARCFDTFNRARRDPWVFGDRASVAGGVAPEHPVAVRVRRGEVVSRLGGQLPPGLKNARPSMNDSTLGTGDARPHPGPSGLLHAITRNPGLRAGDLAEPLGRKTPQLKRDARRLKELGLTHSLDAGYELSRRGRAYINDPYEPRSR